MIVRFSPRPEDLQRLQVGPIGPHLQSFATLVAQQGYCSVTGWLQVRLVAKLSRWLKQHRVPLSELNASRKERRLASVALRQFKAEDIAVKRNGAIGTINVDLEVNDSIHGSDSFGLGFGCDRGLTATLSNWPPVVKGRSGPRARAEPELCAPLDQPLANAPRRGA